MWQGCLTPARIEKTNPDILICQIVGSGLNLASIKRAKLQRPLFAFRLQQSMNRSHSEKIALRTCLSDPSALRSHFYSQAITRVRLAGRMGAGMWTEAHRARHEAGLKERVSTCAVEETARWLERADPPRSEKATPVLLVVSAIAWHLRVGGPWRALPGDFPAWRTVYGWFRRWLELGLFDRLLCDVACLRRRAAGRKPEPSLGIIDT